METTLIVSSGQYETSAVKLAVNHKTWGGLCRRITQLENQYAVYGDNFAGWLKASVSLADSRDEWGDNQIIGGQWCQPYNGWLSVEEIDGPFMSYDDLHKKLYGCNR